jgi:hypothetical protein
MCVEWERQWWMSVHSVRPCADHAQVALHPRGGTYARAPSAVQPVLQSVCVFAVLSGRLRAAVYCGDVPIYSD